MYVVKVLHGYISKENRYTKHIHEAREFLFSHEAEHFAKLCYGSVLAK